MTEDQWKTSTDPAAMLKAFAPGMHAVSGENAYSFDPSRCVISERKLRLFACACVREGWEQLGKQCRKAVEGAESFADESIGEQQRRDLERWAEDERKRIQGGRKGWELRYAAVEVIADAERFDAGGVAYFCAVALTSNPKELLVAHATQAAILREIVGNPLRPVKHLCLQDDGLLLHPGGDCQGCCPILSPTVRAMAEGICEDRAYRELPVLADALEDAGCQEENILSHLRGPGPHALGCWALDLVLGKE